MATQDTSKNWFTSLFSSGGGGDSGGGFWGALAEGILGGIGSRSESRESRRNQQMQIDAARELALIAAEASSRQTRRQGDENRRTIDFEARLTDARRQNEEARRAAGRRGFAMGTSSGIAQTTELPSYQSYYEEPVTPLFTPRGKG